jgi:hypothetical protein
MALANVGVLLAKDAHPPEHSTSPQGVLLIDWDLEAPGLHRFFQRHLSKHLGRHAGNSSEEFGRALKSQHGLIDFFESVAKLRQMNKWGTDPSGYRQGVFEDFVGRNYIMPTDHANLALVSAGRFDDEYGERVRKFNWEDFFNEDPGFFTAFRQFLKERFRYVLIDSRTGLTDTSGICTQHIPEKLAAVFALNHQNVDGTLEVIRKIAAFRRASVNPAPLIVFPLPSRVATDRSMPRYKWREGGDFDGEILPGYRHQFETLFRELHALVPEECDLKAYFTRVEVPQDSDYAFGEKIAVLQDTTDPKAPGHVFAEFARRLVELDAPWQLLPEERAELEKQRAEKRAAEAESSAAASKRWAWLASAALAVALIGAPVWWLLRPPAGVDGLVVDEARRVNRTAGSFPAADADYFRDMDGSIPLSQAEIQGRNMWMAWTGGNDRFWDTITKASAGTLDLLKTLSSHPKLKATRNNRWHYLGLVNEPCFEQATGPDPERFGLWLDKRRADCPPDPFDDQQKYPGVKIGARGKNLAVGSFYGAPSGIVGLRLFPNPDFDEAARTRWDAERFYNDAAFYSSNDLVRPYRVGMSCAFCHVGPSPIRPPADPENPMWKDLSPIVGTQYFRADRIFDWGADESSFIFQLLHTARPGTFDSSLIATDSINNPRAINAFYGFHERLGLAKRWGKETVAGGGLNNKQLNDFVKEGPLTGFFEAPATVYAPRMLKDGADSVGALAALNRMYLSIGTFSEEWLRHFNPLVGGKRNTPIEIAVAEQSSVYWQATEAQTPNMALFFLRATDAHRLKDAPGGQAYLTTDWATLKRGKVVFAERCASCHSSKVPSSAPGIDPGGCAGPRYLECWNKYWAWTKTDEFKTQMREIVLADDFLEGNYLSTELRVPVTLLETNACSPLATNAIGGDIWDNFSSSSYKELPSVGTITVYHPLTGHPQNYEMPAGGRGYTRPPSLISVWSTAPFLLNNSLGRFDAEPSVKGRMGTFQDSIEKMLWPERREQDSNLGSRIPGLMDRTTAPSYLVVPARYMPDLAQQVLQRDSAGRAMPLELGPIPAGTPVNLLANLNLTAEAESTLAERLAHEKRVMQMIVTIKRDLDRLPTLPNAQREGQRQEILASAVDGLFELSKCPDFIVNRGHYFGTDRFTEERGLSDEDKRALIEFLKTF